MVDPTDERRGRGPRSDLSAAACMLRLRQLQLDHVGAPGPEPRLAIAEVEGPQPAEALVEAQGRDLVPGFLEALTPLGQGVGVVDAEAVDPAPAQAGGVGLLLQARLARQDPTGEDVLLDDVGRGAV